MSSSNAKSNKKSGKKKRTSTGSVAAATSVIKPKKKARVGKSVRPTKKVIKKVAKKPAKKAMKKPVKKLVKKPIIRKKSLKSAPVTSTTVPVAPVLSKKTLRRRKAKYFFKRVVVIFLLSVVVYGVWNWATLSTIAQPEVRSFLAGVGRPVATPSYDPSKSRFYFPDLAIEAPMEDLPSSSPLNYVDWGSIAVALTKGVSLNYSSDQLGKARLAYVTGHSSDTYPHPYSSVFAALGQAEVGDEFVLTGKGQVYHYRVISKKVVDPRNVLAFSESSLVGASDKQHIAVVTCWPLLTNAQRLVVVGEKF